MNEPISRRNMLRSGALAAVAASLTTGAADAPVASAQTPPTLGTVHVANLNDMSAESARLAALSRSTMLAMGKAQDALLDTLTAEQRALYDTLEDADAEHFFASHDWRMAELRRHLPGIAPVLGVMVEHIWEGDQRPGKAGTCCMPDPVGDES